MPDNYKKGLIYTLLHRAFVLCSDWNKFHAEVCFLKETFKKNIFPEHFTDKCIKIFLDKVFIAKEIVSVVPKKDITISLPFLGKQSLKTRTELVKLVNRYYPYCKLRVIFNSNNRLRNFFSFKDKVPLSVRSLVLYRFTCNSCNAVYIGKTRRHYMVRIFEHLGISLATHKKFTYNPHNNNNTAVLNHLNCNKCNT